MRPLGDEKRDEASSRVGRGLERKRRPNQEDAKKKSVLREWNLNASIAGRPCLQFSNDSQDAVLFKTTLPSIDTVSPRECTDVYQQYSPDRPLLLAPSYLLTISFRFCTLSKLLRFDLAAARWFNLH